MCGMHVENVQTEFGKRHKREIARQIVDYMMSVIAPSKAPTAIEAITGQGCSHFRLNGPQSRGRQTAVLLSDSNWVEKRNP